MPKSLSHVVVFTDDLDGVLAFLADVAKVDAPVNRYETEPEDLHQLFGWPIEHGRARGAFVGAGAGGLDLLEIPEALRSEVKPGMRLLAYLTRDAAGAGEAAGAAGNTVRGPFATTAATGAPMSLVEVVVGSLPFELVQFG